MPFFFASTNDAHNHSHIDFLVNFLLHSYLQQHKKKHQGGLVAGPQGTILPVGDVLVSVYIHHKWNPPPMSERG